MSFARLCVAVAVLSFVATSAMAEEYKPRCGCSCGKCCTKIVMKTCKEVVYEEVEQKKTRTVYDAKVDKVPVKKVVYLPDTEYSFGCCTSYQEQKKTGCTASCSSCCGAEQTTGTQMVPVAGCKKMPRLVYRSMEKEEFEEHPRLAAREEEYTEKVCVAKVVCKQVPVEVPCCCR